jgi:hypothetical protein
LPLPPHFWHCLPPRLRKLAEVQVTLPKPPPRLLRGQEEKSQKAEGERGVYARSSYEVNAQRFS